MKQNLDALNLVYGPTAFFMRVSIVLFNLKLFGPYFERHGILIIIVVLVQTLGFLIDFSIAFSTHSLCVSIESLRNNFCGKISSAIIVQGGISCILDFLLFCLPLYIISQLKFKRAGKVQVMALLSTGIV